MAALSSEHSARDGAERRAILDRVRATGARGGQIEPHRSIATIDLSATEIAGAVALAALFTAAYAASLAWIARLWSAMFVWLAPLLGLGSGVGHRALYVASVIEVAMPYFLAPAAPPGPTAWWAALLVTLLIVAVSLLMRGDWLPLAYALRFAAAIQASAVLFFALAPTRFPYDLAVYTSGMLVLGATLIGIVPVLFGLTYYVIDVGWSRKILLTVLAMGHLVVFVPLQYALQAAVIVHGSLIVLPVCFVLFGLLPDIMILIALYGWGMSWAPLRARGRRQ